MRYRSARTLARRVRPWVTTVVVTATIAGCTSAPRSSGPSIAGDWDAYLASGSTTHPGFEGWRRMGFAHFAGQDSAFAGSIRRRTGDPMLVVTRVDARSDSLILTGNGDQSIDAVWHGDTLTGVMLSGGKPSGRRIRLVRRTTPFVAERDFALWPGPVSDSQYAVTGTRSCT